MTVYFYPSDYKEKEKEIRRIVGQLLPSDQIEVHPSVKSLFQKLGKPEEDKPIVVVLIKQKEELLDIATLRDQMHPVYLILVLPDAEKETISLGHNLRPNYLTYAHSDMDELKAVLEKMLEKG